MPETDTLEGNTPHILAVTMGDPAGVGPEVLVKSLASYKHITNELNNHRLVIIGSVACLEEVARMCGVEVHLVRVSNINEALAHTRSTSSKEFAVVEPVEIKPEDFTAGKISASCGEAAVKYFEFAIKEAMAGNVHGIVTCPINKEAIHLAGYVNDIGHQEILARMTNARVTATMLMTPGLRVAHLSTHLSLGEAVSFVKKQTIVDKLKLTVDSLKKWGIEKPRIAVAALNPHGGEGGLLGQEEMEEIAPAVLQMKSDEVDVTGPLPADSVFNRAIAGEFDAVLAMYHDQGHIAIKVHDFAQSVTATMGIPFVRTSVDHGTAFDIVGKNKADATSLNMAIETAIAMMDGALK